MDKPNLRELFQQAGRLYNQNRNNFYVSADDIVIDKQHTFIRKAVLQPYRPRVFSEYELGNVNHLDKIYKKWKKENIFLSLHCSLCASDEPYNVANLDKRAQDGVNEYEPNYAYLLREEIKVNNISFIISGSVPQYLYNHLLLYPQSHIATYLLFIIPSYFEAIYKILRTDYCVGVFNGNFGSDVYHAHIHLTNHQFEIINDTINKTPNQPFGKIYIDSPISKCLVFYANSIEELYQQSVKYVLLYFHPKFDRKVHGMSTLLHYSSLNKKYYLFVFVFRLGRQNINEKDCTAQFIIPALIFNLATCQQVERISREFMKRDIFYSSQRIENIYQMDKINLSDGVLAILNNWYKDANMSEIPSELFQLDIFFSNTKGIAPAGLSESQLSQPNANGGITLSDRACDKIEIYSKHSNKLGAFNACKIYDEVQCATNSPTFASYKMIITAKLICKIKRLNLENNYGTLYRTSFVAEAALNDELHNLVGVNKITNIETLTLKGRAQTEVVRATFRHLLNLSNLDKEGTKKWIENLKPIGEKVGVVVKAQLKSLITDKPTNLPFVVKINQVGSQLFRYENNVSVEMAKFRNKVPNFMMGYGMLSCVTNNTSVQLCTTDGKNVDYMFLEYINGISFRRFLINTPYSVEAEISLLLLLAQLGLALNYAKKTTGFTDYDIHLDNLIVIDTPGKLYKYGEDKIAAPKTIVVIDYGWVHLDNIEPPPESEYKPYIKDYGFTIFQKKNTVEVYIVLVDLLTQIAIIHPEYIKHSKFLGKFYRQVDKVLSVPFDYSFVGLIVGWVNNVPQARNNLSDIWKFLSSHRKDKKFSRFPPFDYDEEFGPWNMYDVAIKVLKEGNVKYAEVADVCQWISGDGEKMETSSTSHGCQSSAPVTNLVDFSAIIQRVEKM